MQEPLERAADAGVVEHDVEAAEAVDRVVDQLLHLLGVAHVGALEGGGLAELTGELAAVLLVDVGDHHLGPLRDQQLRSRVTDAAGAARHDRDLALERSRVHGRAR